MHSVNTARPAAPPDTVTPQATSLATGARRPYRRLPLLLMVLVVALGALAGCASDKASDQNRARHTAEAGTSVISGDQATYAANRYASPSLSPTPIPRSAGHVHEMGVAVSVQGNNQPSNFVTSVPTNAGTIYVAANVDGLPENSTVTAILFPNAKKPADRKVVLQASITVSGSGQQWIAVPLQLDGSLPTGQYGVALSLQNPPANVTDPELGSLGIELTSPGTPPKSV